MNIIVRCTLKSIHLFARHVANHIHVGNSSRRMLNLTIKRRSKNVVKNSRRKNSINNMLRTQDIRSMEQYAKFAERHFPQRMPCTSTLLKHIKRTISLSVTYVKIDLRSKPILNDMFNCIRKSSERIIVIYVAHRILRIRR